MAAPTQPPHGTRKSITGFITKLVGDGGTFGFINDEIFFQQDVVVGGPVVLNDRVFAECEYSENLPIKWNATSIKIIQKADSSSGGGCATSAGVGAANPTVNIHDIDPRRRQGLLNPAQTSPAQPQQQQQQQQPPTTFNQQPSGPPAPVANTYQQHRQQRQQQQQQQQQQHQQPPSSHHMGPFDPSFQPDPGMGGHQQPPPMRLLDQSNMMGGPDFFAGQPPPMPFAQPVVTQAHELPPLLQQQHDSPMGPPKITYTSQLGAAFVQNQPGPMVGPPPPFMGQPNVGPPPSMLLNPQQQQQQQSHNNNANNNNQQRNKQGGRFNDNRNNGNNNSNNNNNNSNNQGGKGQDNARGQQEPRGRNRNSDNRSDHQPRNQDRDNNKSTPTRDHSGGSRDRSSGRNISPSRRDRSSRPSPPSHHPINRTRTSISSERSGSQSNSKSSSSSRRSYDPQNIPKTRVLSNLNGYTLKTRFAASVHVPSDLKNVIVNRHFRLDVKNTPKPINYKIEICQKSEAKKEQKENTQSENKTMASLEPETNVEEQQNKDLAFPEIVGEQPVDTDKPSIVETSTTTATATTNVTSNSSSNQKNECIRLNHKYGVKVILPALPEMDSIYKTIFGQDLNSFASTDSTRSKPRLDEPVALLCNRASNGGHSLIGGRFDANLDGFATDEYNEFERQEKQPDLIATCRRVVLEQTGLDLRPCKSWSLLCTFIYNNRTDYFGPKASVEYSYIYMPHIWTMASFNITSSIPSQTEEGREEEVTIGGDMIKTMDMEHSGASGSESQVEPAPKVEENTSLEVEQAPSEMVEAAATAAAIEQPSEALTLNSNLTPEALGDLKVIDLKNELDKRQIKYKPNSKKAELVALLYEVLTSSTAAPVQQQIDTATTMAAETENKVVEGNEDVLVAEGPKSDLKLAAPDETSSAENIAAQDSNVEMLTSIEAQEGHTEEVAPTLKRKTPDEDNINDAAEKERPTGTLEAELDTPAITSDPKVTATKENTEKLHKKQKVELIKGEFVVKTKAEGQQQLAVVPLYDTCSVSRYDQFELSVASNLLRESLVQHLSEYIFTALVEDNRVRTGANSSIGNETNNNSGGSQSSQEAPSIMQSDKNNNREGGNDAMSTKDGTASVVVGAAKLEYPIDRYINLACSYFDSTHIGYLHVDDLSKLFNNTGLTISKRALNALLNDSEKFHYRSTPDLSSKISPTYIYEFPRQFEQIPGYSGGDFSGDDHHGQQGNHTTNSAAGQSGMLEYKGVKYNIESLIQQVQEGETMRVNMIERFNYAIENFDKQTDELHVLEVNRKNLTNLIKTHGDEIQELKRERDTLKKKLDHLRKGLKNSIGSLNDLLT